MPGLLNADASFSSKQELLDLGDYPMNEGPSLHTSGTVNSGVGSPISSDPRHHGITATGDTDLPRTFTGNSLLPGHVCSMETRCHAENPIGLNLKSTDSDQLCGWGALTPKSLQFFNTPHWVLFFLCMASFLQGMIVNGLVNTVITSIERRFDLRSYQTGLIVSSYDIAGCVCLAFVSYFGGNGHKTQWLGFGVLIMGLGSLVFALPHFTTPSYQAILSEQPGMCSANRTSLGQNKEDGDLSNYRFIFMLGQFLLGVGATPLYTLGVTYLDENVNSNHAPVYIGIYYTAAILGPAAGYMLGGYFLNIYTETNLMTVMTPEDPLWVGAWWIGFLAGGVAALLVAIPILGYPHQLPGSQELAAMRVSEAHQLGDGSQSTISDPQFGKSVKDMPRSVLLLLKNPTFLFLCLAGATEATLIAGVSTFGPKYLESQFNLSASEAATWFGFMVVPAGGGGTFLGGFIVKKLNLRCRGIIRFCMMCAAISLLAIFIFLINCPNVPMAGVTAPYHTGLMKEQLEQNKHTSSPLEVNLTVACNAGCNCIREVYNPVCGADGVMYYSPCHAGCTAINLTEDSMDKKVYIGCSCVLQNISRGEERFTLAGKCGTSCHYMPVFLFVFFIISSFTFLASIPALTATLRCVSHAQRSFGLGIQWIVMRAFGSIPGPIAFGSMIDISCLLWQDKNGDRGSCYVYQNSAMSRYTLGAGIIYKALGLIFFMLASILYQPPPESPQSSRENTDHGGVYLPSKDISEDDVIVNQHATL